MIKKAFILGAGFGTRLKPLTFVKPKPLIPVLGKPLIEYSINHLKTIGINQIIVNTHHLPEQFKRELGTGKKYGIKISYSYEPQILDTGGGLKNIESYLEKLNKKIEEWTQKIAPFKGTPVIFYHNQWSYFCERFGIIAANFLEPKPGIKPSASHVAKLIKQVRDQKIRVIAISPFYEDRNPKMLARSTGAKLVVLPTMINPEFGSDNYIELFDYLIESFVTNLSKP